MRVINLLLLVSLFCSSCWKKKLPAKEYYSYVVNEENNLHKNKSINDFIFDVQFKPVDFIICSEYKNQLNRAVYSQRKSELEGMVYFNLKLKNKNRDLFEINSENVKDVELKRYYYSFDFAKDIYLEQNGNVIPCGLFHLERSYDLNGFKMFQLAFPVKTVSNDLTLVIDSRILALGPVKVNFKKKDISNIPSIEL